MMVSRRQLLQSSSTVIPVGMFLPSVFSQALDQMGRNTLYGQPGRPSNNRTLIIVQLAGGNDGLNTLIPYSDGRYRDMRPTIGVPESELLPVSEEVAFHKELEGLKGLYDQGKVAVIQTVGYDHPSLSHFQAMDIWETADPSLHHQDGWLSTLVEGQVDSHGHPIGSLSLGPSLAPALCCPPTPPPTVSAINDYQLKSDPRFPHGAAVREQALVQLYQTYHAPAPFAAVLDSTADQARASAAMMQEIAHQYKPMTAYPQTPLAQGLKLLAATLKAGSGLRIGYVVLGGFDTHAQQVNQQPRLLRQLGDAIRAFYGDLAAQHLDEQVLLMTWSEFGRRVQENASHGTDHGTAAPLFLVGSGVKGGLYGDPPDLTHLDTGNLKHSIDFRSVYATVIERWLQADSKPILGGAFPTLPAIG
ncbi:MAG: DUF1501 domain-containing protein [Chloroflexi bacterium]|nr:DUF1501 domain-containing protein [Chloroflexota bacterium]